MPSVRVAAVQHAPVFLDRDASLAKALDLIGEAAASGARLVVFGETWLPRYPAWIFGASGWDDAAAKRAHARLLANSVEVPGAATAALCRAARRHGVHLVMGINELEPSPAARSTTRLSPDSRHAQAAARRVLVDAPDARPAGPLAAA